MASVIFYEKPGCINNTKQKALLEEAGHEVIAKNLLTETWTSERLASFFKGYLVSEWFNRSAPRIKSGEIIPEQIQANEAIQMMIADPLLIRRPLMQVGHEYFLGFNQESMLRWLQITMDTQQELETCPRNQHACATPTTATSEL